MSRFQYIPLPDAVGSIRLLRLLPAADETAAIHCELFHYQLPSSGEKKLPYAALSYVWGNADHHRTIFLDGYQLDITPNLYDALLCLRDCGLPQILWIDAICINQADEKEKVQQIQSMAKIYGRAGHVIAYLGKAADDSDLALEAIQLSSRNAMIQGHDERVRRATIALLRREWFRRIWVLQEIAAARSVTVMCGDKEVNGHVFSTGLKRLEKSDEACSGQHDQVRPVTYLIQESLLRPAYSFSGSERESLDICSLAELLDMYHTHRATDRHDKVYALFGMSSDNLQAAGFAPDYQIPWEDLSKKLIKYIIGEAASIDTWPDREMGVIRGKGSVIGLVSSATILEDNNQALDIRFTTKAGHYLADRDEVRWSTWILKASANLVQVGDIVCILQGASKPTIVRQCWAYFAVIMIAVNPKATLPKDLWSQYVHTFPPNDLVLVWDWQISPAKLQEREHYKLAMNGRLEYLDADPKGAMDKATRMWKVGTVLWEAGERARAKQLVLEAMTAYSGGEAFDERLFGHTPMTWAARCGNEVALQLLLTQYGDDLDSRDVLGQTALSSAIDAGRLTIVNLLLATGKVNINDNNTYGETPLITAATEGQVDVIDLLLKTGRVNPDARDIDGATPLWRAAYNGHENIVKLLLETGKVNPDARDICRATPLGTAAYNGHENIVKLMLETNFQHPLYMTPSEVAKQRGHQSVFELLEQHEESLALAEYPSIEPDLAESTDLSARSTCSPS